MNNQAKNTLENDMQCYAPLYTDEEEVKDEFFDSLHDTLADIQQPISNGIFQQKSREWKTQAIWDSTEDEFGTSIEKDFWRCVQVTT